MSYDNVFLSFLTSPCGISNGGDAAMIKQEIGKYKSFILEREDMVVVMGEVAKHRAFLDGTGV